MSGNNTRNRNPEEPKTYVEDVDKAYRMANAEKPFRDESIELREIGKNVLALQLKEDIRSSSPLWPSQLEEVTADKSDKVAKEAQRILVENIHIGGGVDALMAAAEDDVATAKKLGDMAGEDYDAIKSRQEKIQQIK